MIRARASNPLLGLASDTLLGKKFFLSKSRTYLKLFARFTGSNLIGSFEYLQAGTFQNQIWKLN
jgi:hypothetical protein